MTARDPRMLPGMTAHELGNLVVWWVLGFGALALGAFIYVCLAHPFDDLLTTLIAAIAPLGTWFLGSTVAARLAVARQRAEIAAGYTTNAEVTSVDQIDSKTGTIVRAALGRVAAPRAGGLGNGQGLESIPLAHGFVGIALRSPVAVGLTLLGAGLTIFAFVSVARVINNGGAAVVGYGLLATFSFLLFILAPLFALTILPMRAYRRAIVQAFPAARVWVTYAGSDLRTSAQELVTESDHPNHPHARLKSFVVAETERLSFWSRNGRSLRSFLVIARTRVTAAENGTTTDLNSNTVPAAILTVVSDAGVPVRVALPLGPNSALTRWSAQSEMSANAASLVHWQTTGGFD